MIVRNLVLATTAALAASCTSTAGQWSKPGATQAMLTADAAQCQYETDRATAAIENPVHAGVQDSLLVRSCMNAKGWKR
jgi:hypothetical protein